MRLFRARVRCGSDCREPQGRMLASTVSKAELRALGLARRAAMTEAERQDASVRAVDASEPLLLPGETVSLFWPMRGEIDPRGLIDDVLLAGGRIAMPVVEKRKMFFRRFDGEECLEPGVFGTSHPNAGQPVGRPGFHHRAARRLRPARRAHRLWRRPLRRGDRRPRSRAASAPRLAGIAFACQEVDAVPIEPHDVRLPLIATERELIEGGAGRVRLLFLGDVVGRSGRKAVTSQLPGLIERHRFDFVVVNGENAAGGFGITEEILQELVAAGADCVTTGNHVWDQREALTFADRHERFLRPVNYPPGTPGRGANVYAAKNGARVLVVNVMGSLFMHALDDPFQAVTREISACAHRQRLRRGDRRLPRRSLEREADHGLLPRRQGLARHRHAHACADRRLEDSSRRHRLS